mgnify:CR=1 FL=1
MTAQTFLTPPPPAASAGGGAAETAGDRGAPEQARGVGRRESAARGRGEADRRPLLPPSPMVVAPRLADDDGGQAGCTCNLSENN